MKDCRNQPALLNVAMRRDRLGLIWQKTNLRAIFSNTKCKCSAAPGSRLITAST